VWHFVFHYGTEKLLSDVILEYAFEQY